MVPNYLTAQWEHSKKKAELIAGDVTFIEMEFGKKTTLVKFGKNKFEISYEGFWCPRIMIRQKGDVVALQKHLGFWSSKSEFEIYGTTYTARTKQGVLFNITYSLGDKELLTYKLDTSKRKIQILVEVKTIEIPEQHWLLLMALGFYSIKNVALEAGANDFIIAAVA